MAGRHDDPRTRFEYPRTAREPESILGTAENPVIENGGLVLAFKRTPETDGRDYVVRFANKGSWRDKAGRRVSVHSANVLKDSWENRWPVRPGADAFDLDQAFVKSLALTPAEDAAIPGWTGMPTAMEAATARVKKALGVTRDCPYDTERAIVAWIKSVGPEVVMKTTLKDIKATAAAF